MSVLFVLTACAPAALTEQERDDILALDRSELNWRAVFAFGLQGDESVPYLLGKLDDDNINVRANSVNILGLWLISPDAVPAMQARYFNEPDAGIRKDMLVSLERLMVDQQEVETYFRKVVATEQDPALKRYAQETVDGTAGILSQVEAYRQKKLHDRSKFQSEYQSLWDSYGKSGDYEMLLLTSMASDELQLKRLKRRVLKRGSDEALHDYQNINGIILTNRLIGPM